MNSKTSDSLKYLYSLLIKVQLKLVHGHLQSIFNLILEFEVDISLTAYL